MNILIVTAALPPKLDGIGDYTAHLATEIAKSAQVTVLVGQTEPIDPISGVTVKAAFEASEPRSVWQIAKRVEESPPDWLLLQYQPFAYGKWGRNGHLPRVMAFLKRRCPQTRLAVMVHEPFVPLTTWQFAVMSTWQRRQLRQLGQMADVLFFSIQPWAQQFAGWFPHKPVLHLPVGSNIPRVPIARAEARARLGLTDETLVLGLFGTAHPARMPHWVAQAAEAIRQTGQDVTVLYIGPHKDRLCGAFGSLPFIGEGPLPAAEVSRRFAAMDMHFAPYDDGVSTRRGALMAGLQHGIATVGTRGHLTDPMLAAEDGRALLLADVSEPETFVGHARRLAADIELRAQIGRQGQQLYGREFAWEQIARRLWSALAESPHP